jgi:hypothetical protein
MSRGERDVRAKQIGMAACAIVLIGACGGSNGNDPAPAATSAGEWSSRAALPTARRKCLPPLWPTGSTPRRLQFRRSVSTVLETYDVATDRWSTGRALTEARHHPGVTAAAGIVYVMGGYAANGAASATVFAFNPATQQWTTRQPMPAASGALVLVEHSGKIYAIGGVRGVRPTNEVYDPLRTHGLRWPHAHCARTPHAAAIGDRIYVVGGRAPSNTPALEAYAPATNTWERLPDMPTSRGGLAAAALNGKLYVFGGEIPGVFPHTEEYDPVQRRWRRVADMPTPRHGMGAVTVGDGIHVMVEEPLQGSVHLHTVPRIR